MEYGKTFSFNDSRIEMDWVSLSFSPFVPPWCEFYCALLADVEIRRCWLNVFCDKRGRIPSWPCCRSGSGCGWVVDVSIRSRVATPTMGRSTAQFSVVPDETWEIGCRSSDARNLIIRHELGRVFSLPILTDDFTEWYLRHAYKCGLKSTWWFWYSSKEIFGDKIRKGYLESKHTACHVTIKCYDCRVILKCI